MAYINQLGIADEDGAERLRRLKQAPGKVSKAARQYGQLPVQRIAGGKGQTGGDVGAIASAGVAGATQPLPHLETLQRSFGPEHDLGSISAAIGGDAASASEAIGAHAYATGSTVAFSETPGLHTAAHEAAHIVQQRSGAVPSGYVGTRGDAHERHADAVADAVVAGDSAADLLFNSVLSSARSPQRAVQRKKKDKQPTLSIELEDVGHEQAVKLTGGLAHVRTALGMKGSIVYPDGTVLPEDKEGKATEVQTVYDDVSSYMKGVNITPRDGDPPALNIDILGQTITVEATELIDLGDPFTATWTIDVPKKTTLPGLPRGVALKVKKKGKLTVTVRWEPKTIAAVFGNDSSAFNTVQWGEQVAALSLDSPTAKHRGKAETVSATSSFTWHKNLGDGTDVEINGSAKLKGKATYPHGDADKGAKELPEDLSTYIEGLSPFVDDSGAKTVMALDIGGHELALALSENATTQAEAFTLHTNLQSGGKGQRLSFNGILVQNAELSLSSLEILVMPAGWKTNGIEYADLELEMAGQPQRFDLATGGRGGEAASKDNVKEIPVSVDRAHSFDGGSAEIQGSGTLDGDVTMSTPGTIDKKSGGTAISSQLNIQDRMTWEREGDAMVGTLDIGGKSLVIRLGPEALTGDQPYTLHIDANLDEGAELFFGATAVRNATLGLPLRVVVRPSDKGIDAPVSIEYDDIRVSFDGSESPFRLAHGEYGDTSTVTKGKKAKRHTASLQLDETMELGSINVTLQTSIEYNGFVTFPTDSVEDGLAGLEGKMREQRDLELADDVTPDGVVVSGWLAGQQLLMKVLGAGLQNGSGISVRVNFTTGKNRFTFGDIAFDDATATMTGHIGISPNGDASGDHVVDDDVEITYADGSARFGVELSEKGKVETTRDSGVVSQDAIDAMLVITGKFISYGIPGAKHLIESNAVEAFLLYMRPRMGTDEATIAHFGAIEPVTIPDEDVWMWGPAATALQAVYDEVGEEHFPSINNTLRFQEEYTIGKVQSKHAGQHQLGVGIDVGKVQLNPHVKDDHTEELLATVTGESPRMNSSKDVLEEARRVRAASDEFKTSIPDAESKFADLAERYGRGDGDEQFRNDLADVVAPWRKAVQDASEDLDGQNSTITKEIAGIEADRADASKSKTHKKLTKQKKKLVAERKKNHERLTRLAEVLDLLKDPAWVLGEVEVKKNHVNHTLDYTTKDPAAAQLAINGFNNFEETKSENGSGVTFTFVEAMKRHGFQIGAGWIDGHHFEYPRRSD